MDRMCAVILYYSLTVIKGKANRSENEVFAIPGCNATLEWILGPTYLTAYTRSINIFNANGIEIAMMEYMKCQHVMIDSSMPCDVQNISDKGWRLTVVLVNVTRSNSGKYLGQIKYGERNETKTKELKIIDKPKIRESQRPILHKPFSTTCTVDGEFDDLIYKWKLNGTYLSSTKRINASSSYLIFTRLTMADKMSLFSCSVCSEISCCMESEFYAPDPYYGPDNVTLSLNEGDFYLRANESFNITCSAKCHPVCYFMWDGYIHDRNAELVISRFDSKMDGVYECTATNPETSETAKSRSVYLHYVPDSTFASSPRGNVELSSFASSPSGHGDHRVELLGVGLVIVAVLLVIIGVFVLVTVWRKHGSTRLAFTGSRLRCQPNFGLNIPKSPREFTKKQDRPLANSDVNEHQCRNVKRSKNQKNSRKSKSFSNFLDDTQNIWNPVRESLSLQSLIHLSHKIGRRMKSNESASKMCGSCSNSLEYSKGPADGIGQEELLSNIQKEKKVINDDRINCLTSLSIKCSELGSFNYELQKDLNSTIDEVALSIKNNDRAKEPKENLPHDHSETGNYVYDYAVLPSLVRDAENSRHLQVDEK